LKQNVKLCIVEDTLWIYAFFISKNLSEFSDVVKNESNCCL